MAYKKKTWVNVPDPDSYTGDTPLSALPRFDAENMNRIEGGIEEALNVTKDDVIVGTVRDRNSTDGGIRFGIVYSEEDIPISGVGTQKGGNDLLLASACNYTNTKKEEEFDEIGYYFPVKLPEGVKQYPSAIRISSHDGKVYALKSNAGSKHYEKDEMLNMLEYEMLHTGNKNLITSNDTNSLSIGGGTAIPSNADLNSYTNIGNYTCALTDTALTLSNCPVQLAFVMTVGYAAGSPSYIYQEIRQFNTGARYYRTRDSGGTWSKWITSYNTATKPTPSDIGAAAIATGSYVGTGTYGNSNKNSLTFSFEPKLVIIQDRTEKSLGASKRIIFVYDSPLTDSGLITVEWNKNGVSWYTTNNDSEVQLNAAGRTYRYVAIG